mmetsp:Transcript_34014/g.73554  ORF Transcript_34014/g.73554 Transcript_34014/m.73554 type:complete len:264 (+) Transcript_34014:128-919(+)
MLACLGLWPSHSTRPVFKSYTAPCSWTSPLRTLSLKSELLFRMVSMVLKTFTETAKSAISFSLALGPNCAAASPATELKPASKPSSAPLSFAGASPFLLLRYVAVAPLMAPQLVCPSTMTKRVRKAVTQNSRLPMILPLAWVTVLPAFRITKRSPGRTSKTSSRGTRLSAQPTTAVCGACPIVERAFRISLSNFPAMGFPWQYRSLPSFISFRAASGSIGLSSVVRTARVISFCIEGGKLPFEANSSWCLGERPRNSTRPVSR